MILQRICTPSTVGAIGYLGIYNLTTGGLIKGINLRPYNPYLYFFPNGITTDKNGIIYITDSFSPCIYKVNNSYKTDLLVNDPRAFSYKKATLGLTVLFIVKKGI